MAAPGYRSSPVRTAGRALRWLPAGLALLLAVLAAAPLLVDSEWLAGRLDRTASQILGREVETGGRHHLVATPGADGRGASDRRRFGSPAGPIAALLPLLETGTGSGSAYCDGLVERLNRAQQIGGAR